MVAGVVPQWGRIAKSVFDLGRDSNSDGNRSAQSSANCGMARQCGSPRLLTSKAEHIARAVAAHTTDYIGSSGCLCHSRTSSITAAQPSRSPDDGPARQPVRSRRSPVRVARSRTISRWAVPPRDYDETFRAGPNMNRRIAIVGDRLSDGGTVNANVGPPLSVVSISGTKARSRLRSWPPGSDEDWFSDLSNSKEILFWEEK
ncbi:hypothetical protein IST455A_01861 [Burkholderia multivorans]|nr:hypothetical protein IST424_01972 [Burkholderia multivorans]CAB5288334.1 hypothetical protein IST461_01018 [Burkholderia multivorans]CAB5288743.1 hypothetical protein IST419_01973 [Burkholderia multivorans]CAB5294345.1 hypothetical protein IST453_02048 [Burkholderia multivorans]CAB5305976.1 hypothetical protein IST4119_02195 [Burkholderia multivorans]